MKEFLAIYLGATDPRRMSDWNQLDEASRQTRQASGMQAWHAWMEANKDAISVRGGPLGKTLRADAHGITTTKNQMTGYVVVRAASLEEAAQLFDSHPHFSIFPGEAVEIMECLPIPGAV
jgi:hypothetical protein